MAEQQLPGLCHCTTCRRSSRWLIILACPASSSHSPAHLVVQDINLRELTKKYGRGIGLNINAVSKYAAQMLIALYHLSTCGVLHAGGPASQCCSPLCSSAILEERAGAKELFADGFQSSAKMQGCTLW